MAKIQDQYRSFSPQTRRLLIVFGFTILAFLAFSLGSLGDLLSPVDYRDYIVNPIPILLTLLGLVAFILAWNRRVRAASYLMIASIAVGFILIAIFTAQPTYSTIAELVIIVVPLMIALHSLSEREFIWVIILTIVFRSAIQFIGTYKIANPNAGASAQTQTIAEWAAAIVAILFALYIAFNLNNYAFRVKMILVLGILTIVPTSVLTTVSQDNLQSTLVDEANKSLVLTSDQLASSFNTFIQTTLDTTRIEAQSPGLVSYLGQPRPSATFGGQPFPRGTELETVAVNTLYSFLRKDPINIVACRLIDNTGTIQLSTTAADELVTVTDNEYYYLPSTNGLPYLSPIFITPNGLGNIHFSSAVRNNSGVVVGVLDIVYSESVLQQILVKNSDKLGKDVSSMLLDDNQIVLAHSSQPDLIFKIINPANAGTIEILSYEKRLPNLPADQLSFQMDGLTEGIQNIANSPYFSGTFEQQQNITNLGIPNIDQAGASKLQSLKWYVVTYVPQSTLLAPAQNQTRQVVLISILIGLLAIAVALGVTQVLVSPILSLTRTSQTIAQGEMTAVAHVTTHDEIGELAKTFNAMTERIRGLVGGLEERVSERTKALEQRAIQLKAAADVGSAAARMRNLDDLLQQSARLISHRFGYYHVGIFLVDDMNEYAVLRASNSEGGQAMLTRGHKLKIGEVGIVGNVAGTGLPRIALKVGQDAAFFNNPDLPLTQSEMALPLIAGGKILGVLDIQSTNESAFMDEDIATLKVLADQISVAIENARLFSESQAALESARRAYGEMSRSDWRRLVEGKLDVPGYLSFGKDKVVAVTEEPRVGSVEAIQTGRPILSQDGKSLHLPIKIRNEPIGAIRLEKPAGAANWSEEEINSATALSDQLGIALDSARLYTDISQRAEREFLISEITSKIGSSIRLETILRTTVEELGQAFRDSDIVLQIGQKNGNNKGNESE